MKLKAVFLDKDGTLIPGTPLNADDNRVELSERLIEGLQLLQSYGYLLVIISNKFAIPHGSFTPGQLEQVNNAITSMFMKLGIYLDGFYDSANHPDETIPSYAVEAESRKPESGLFFKAAGDMDIDLSSSWIIGEIPNSVEAGSRAGCKTILINNDNNPAPYTNPDSIPQFRARDLAEAARYILTATN